MEDEVLDQPGSTGEGYNFDEKVQKLLTEGYEFNIGTIISAGNKILMKDLGSFIGYLLLYLVIVILISLIPDVGSLANFVIAYPLIMGFAIVSRKIFQQKSFTFRNFYDGFKFIGPLLTVRIIITVITILIVLPYVFLTMWSFFLQIMQMYTSGDANAIDPGEVLSMIGKLIPLIILLLIFSPLFAWAPYIVVFGRKSAWDSLVTSVKLVWKRLIFFILFFIVIILINLCGAVLILVGLLYTVPLSICASYAAYEMIVGTNPDDAMLDSGQ